ncbi:MAG: tail fiber domain-containing protein [Candidatus Udaeobacter sp.]
MKRNIRSVLMIVALSCVAADAPKTHAVVPAPDGGYPNFTTAEGTKALFSLTNGAANTAVGWYSLFSNAEGSFNTATGAGTLLFNTADNNTAVGGAALLFNTEGSNNTAVGAGALLNNSIGGSNTSTGTFALASNTTGGANTAVGSSALYSNTTGVQNTAIGDDALFNNTIGQNNAAIGRLSLFHNTEGVANTATGAEALTSNVTGIGNTAIGYQALTNATDDGNTALGYRAGLNVTTASNVISIGHLGANVSNSCFINNIRGATGAMGDGISVLIDSRGQLATSPSSRRFKKEIKPMDQTSEAILALTPVTFHYKSDSTGTPQFGLIAEEVEKVNPDLVVCDEKGEIYTVRYEAVNAMLLNEFLKEHRRGEAQQKELDALKAEFKEQSALIQKVNDKVELNRPAPQTVVSDQ